ncbi:hypothetical protein ACVXZZ_05060 [Staphylococcus aureus]
MGSTLGHIALILIRCHTWEITCHGGGATRIADTLIQKFG